MANGKGWFIGGLAALVGIILLTRKAVATIKTISYSPNVGLGFPFTVTVSWEVGQAFTGNLVFYCPNQAKTYLGIVGGSPVISFSPGTRTDSMTAIVPLSTPVDSYLVNVQVLRGSEVVAEGWGTTPVGVGFA